MTDRRNDREADRLAAEAAAVLQGADDRRRRGAFFTPPDVAAALVGHVVGGGTVVDPACGAGVFLLAAARRLYEDGCADRRTLVRRCLFGADVDSASVVATRRILAAWAGVDPDEVVGVVVGDPLRDGSSVWPDRPPDGFDSVVGNPPFLGQLRSSTARTDRDRALLGERFGSLMGAYTDAAWLFLSVGLDLLAPGGRLVLIQPQSVLAARDAGPVRDQLAAEGRLVGLWLDRSRVFAGRTEVCAPIVERRTRAGGPDPEVLLLADRRVEPAGTVPAPVAGQPWGPLVAGLLGIPAVPRAGPETVVDRAAVTAGFRQHYYGLVGAVHERTGPDDDRPPLVTTSAVDPLRCRWATAPCRFDGRRWCAPVVDRAAVAARSPEVAAWLDRRRRPKLLVATQTAILEVVVDPVGDLVPLTPLIVVEPEVDDLWHLAATLSAPVTAARAARRSVGAARTAGRIKLSAGQVAALPLPTDRGAWDTGAQLAERLHDLGAGAPAEAWLAFGDAMGRAYGVHDEGLVSWWWGRHPARRDA